MCNAPSQSYYQCKYFKIHCCNFQRPSRATLTRGGSQEDPQKLLRDLQDSLEREADLREQLKNAEEEVHVILNTILYSYRAHNQLNQKRFTFTIYLQNRIK